MKTYNLFVACFFAIVLSSSVVSCGDDNDEVFKVDCVVRDTVEIHVPNEGGEYTVKVDLPGKLQLEKNELILSNSFCDIYEYRDGKPLCDTRMEYEKTLSGNILKIVVQRLNASAEYSNIIRILDEAERVVAVVRLVQAGRFMEFGDLPELGDRGVAIANSVAERMTVAMSNISMAEQYNLANRDLFSMNAYGYIVNVWDNLLSVHNDLVRFRQEEARLLDVYGHYFNVYLAMGHSALVQLWGDVPYQLCYKGENSNKSDWKRLPQAEVLAYLKTDLLAAIEQLEEKRNLPFADADDFFFVSKDVARFVLANIYMFEGNYAEASSLLETILSNGFYQLDASKEYDKDRSQEIIWGLVQDEHDVLDDFNFRSSSFVPYATLTDVYLSLAECQYYLGNETGAQEYLQQVVSVKGMKISEDSFLMQLKNIREQLLFYSGGYFCFLKRNGLVVDLYGIEEYRLLFPIPTYFIKDFEGIVTQNPGYGA